MDLITEVTAITPIAFGTINIVGGFLVTDRMLGMFRGRSGRRDGKDKQ